MLIVNPRNTKFYLREGNQFREIQGELEGAAYSPDENKSILCGSDGYPQPSYIVKLNEIRVSTESYSPYQSNGDRYTRWAAIPNSAFPRNAYYSLSCKPRFGKLEGPTAKLHLRVSGTNSFLQCFLLDIDGHRYIVGECSYAPQAMR